MALKPRLYSFAGIIALTASPYACHKPTAQEGYAHARRCFAALDANLKIVPAARFEEVGLDPDSVDFVRRETVSGAFDLGKSLGMSPGAINQDLERASAAFVKSHSWQPVGTTQRKFVAMGFDLNDCLLDYFGRPND